MDSESYESSLSSPESDYAPAPKKKAPPKKKKVETTYKAKHTLKPPRATTYTAQSLVDQLYRAEIDLEPEYQRDVVWPDAKQVGLVDSIIRNYYVPPIVFKVETKEDGTEFKTCIDGKQRLTTIERFMGGQIYHRDIDSNKKYYYTEPPKRNALRLPEPYRRAFANKQIVCVEYTDLTEDDEREIFKRVQLGMALTAAERLQAISSPTADFVRECMATYLTDSTLAGPHIDWEQTRGSDFRCTAQVIYNISRQTAARNFGSLNQLEAWLNASEPVPSKLHEDTHLTFRIFTNLVRDPELAKLALGGTPGAGKAGPGGKIAPVEFIAIGALIARHNSALTGEELAKAIRDMRKAIRAKNKDIRLNDTIGKQFVEWIKNVPAGKGRRGVSAALTLGAKEETKVKEEKDGPSGKRKRKEQDSDEEDENPPPMSAKRPAPAKPSVSAVSKTPRTTKVEEQTSPPPRTKATPNKTTRPNSPTTAAAQSHPPSHVATPSGSAVGAAPNPRPSGSTTGSATERPSAPPITTIPGAGTNGMSSHHTWSNFPNGPHSAPGIPSTTSLPNVSSMNNMPLAASLMSMGEPVPMAPRAGFTVPPLMPMMGQGIPPPPWMMPPFMPNGQGMTPFPPFAPTGQYPVPPTPSQTQPSQAQPTPAQPSPAQPSHDPRIQIKQEQREGMPALSASHQPSTSHDHPPSASQAQRGHRQTLSDGSESWREREQQHDRPRDYDRDWAYSRDYESRDARERGRGDDLRDERGRPKPSYAGSGGGGRGYRRESGGSQGRYEGEPRRYESRWDTPRR